MIGLLPRLFGARRRSGGPRRKGRRAASYEEAKKLALDRDREVRRQIARRPDIEPEILYYLAEDSDRRVRREIAANPATPRQANLVLAGDEDDDVRIELARKIARLAPELPMTKRDHLQDLTLRALELLARDTLPRVRQLIAEEIKQLENVPKPLVKALAKDLELVVAAPILEYSPLLNDQDLIEIINAGPVQGALAAISRRSAVAEPVASAIVRSEDAEAIRQLLANPRARLTEETLDRVIDRAPDHRDWHEPLVLRPHLSARATQHIARFVTASLLTVLEQHHDLDSALKREVAQRVGERLADPAAEGRAAAYHEAEALCKAGRLDEELILARAGRGERDFVTCAIALLAELEPATVRKVLAAKSPKGITALAWGAGLSMRASIQIQTRIAGVPPGSVLYAKNGTDFPFDEDELQWRLEMFSD